MAARMWDQVLTVWSTNPDKMEQLHCFSAVKYNCPVSMVEHEIYPIAFFEGDGRQQRRYKLQKYKYKYSLVVLEKVHSSWVQKTLTCFPITTLPPFLVTDSCWLAFQEKESKKLRVWVLGWRPESSRSSSARI